ncbi:hypothetical protein O9G_006285, partial [Rozella allomycis CSF55]
IKLKHDSPAEHSIVGHIYQIFDRALRKFGGDVSLWLQYIECAKQNNSSSILGRLFARAIQVHPMKPGFWIMAASWEFEQNGNVGAARKLMQRALRINPQAEKLWLEYFRLEWMFINLLKERRKVLGLKDQEQEGQIEIPQLEEEKESTFSLKSFDGIVPIIIYKNACSVLQSQSFHKNALEIAKQYEGSEKCQALIIET